MESNVDNWRGRFDQLETDPVSGTQKHFMLYPFSVTVLKRTGFTVLLLLKFTWWVAKVLLQTAWVLLWIFFFAFLFGLISAAFGSSDRR